MAIIRQHRLNKTAQTVDSTGIKQNGTNDIQDEGASSKVNIKDDIKITSGGIPKNGKAMSSTICTLPNQKGELFIITCSPTLQTA